MDRNDLLQLCWSILLVALRKESVDRNYDTTALMKCQVKSLSARRAWIEMFDFPIVPAELTSLSARRAWIEMFFSRSLCAMSRVALRKESVDRNNDSTRRTYQQGESLSARRAWIEICGGACARLSALVALRKESVDRNLWWGVRKAVGSLSLSARRAWIEIIISVTANVDGFCRSPQGERG